MEQSEKGMFYEQIGVAMTCRSLEEYERMFSLPENWEQAYASVLDVAGGASSFTADAVRKGVSAVAVDPMYELSSADLEKIGGQEMAEVQVKIAALEHRFDWAFYGSPEQHSMRRLNSFRRFIQHYAAASSSQCYISGRLPQLPFADESFELVLCSHFLFLYGEQFDYDFHYAAICELLRVVQKGGELRIYPLVDLKWKAYPYMERLVSDIVSLGMQVEEISSGLPFIPSSSKLLKISKP